MGLMLLSVFSSGFAQASDITADMVIKLTNKARETANTAVLKKNDLLTQAAQKKAQDMIDHDYFAHVSPQGKSPWDWIEGSGYNYHFAGENLAINFTNAEDEQKAWMDSPLHRKNILNSDYQEIGVAVEKGVIGGNKTIVTVQEFGTKMPEAVATADSADALQSKASVAGVSTSSPTQINGLQKISDKINLSKLFENNSRTLIAWFGAFALALGVIVVDVFAVFHEKHDQLFILHGARSRRS